MACHNFDLNALPNEEISFDLNESQSSEVEEVEGELDQEVQFDLNESQSSEVEEVERELDQEVQGELNEEIQEELEDTIIDLTLDRIDGDHEHNTSNPGSQRRNIRILSNGERQIVYNALLERSVNGKLKRTTTKEVSLLLSIPIRTIQRIWKQAKDTPFGVAVDVSYKKAKVVGRKRIDAGLSCIASLPLNQRRTMRSLSHALPVSYGTVYNRLKEGKIRRHSNAIKPHLKDEHKRARLQFCLSMLERNSLSNEPQFVDMYNVVHIDEKWFYMTKKSRTYYLSPQEEDPLRSCQSKNFIGKVMFLTAIARPRFDACGNEIFSGKIGVFPFVTKQPALRGSRNRPAGTLETKPILSVKKETIRAVLLDKVIPAIQAMWPSEDSSKTIFIQQDNARTHVRPDDEEFRLAASQNGFDIRLLCQPANSPDLNVLDLGFFNAIQSLQDKKCTKTVDELIHAVEEAFEEYPTKKINYVFLSLQLCMKEIMRVGGSNRYKIPHMKKEALDRIHMLPKQITCDFELVENARALLG